MTAPRSRPEILAPAGDEAALRAAVQAGADAVYFGLQGFNARARAANFDAAALEGTLAYLHQHGVRGYVTLNTLVFDAELPALEAAVRACAEAGADAVIVQDLGVCGLVRAIAPGLPIHASTQMTCTDAGAVAVAAAAGASRVILARELSLADIARIRAATEVPLEVFVHGALCVAYSGQCLTSEAIGGRSANRGACAQACRLPYALIVDGEEVDLGERAYLLSPEDLEASALVPQLMALGVASLKIEGRLKGPAYVAATTRLYREAVDAALAQGPAVRPGRREAALQMYSRGSGPGFLQGVDHQRLVEGRACDHRGLLLGTCLGTHGDGRLRARLTQPLGRGDGILVEGGREGAGEIGGRVWSIEQLGQLGPPGPSLEEGQDVTAAPAGAEVLLWLGPERPLPALPAGRRLWKTSDPGRERAVLAEVARAPHRQPLQIRVRGALGEAPLFVAEGPHGLHAAVRGDCALAEARGDTPIEEVLRDKLGRLADTPFTLAALQAELPPRCALPPSSINRARRELVARLLAASQRAAATTDARAAELLAAAAPPPRPPPPPGLFVLCRGLAQAEAALDAGADGVYLDFLELTGTGAALRALRQGRPGALLGVAPPRIRKPGEEKIDRYLEGLAPDLVLVRGLGALGEVAEVAGGPARIGDFSLNVANRLSAAAVLQRGLGAFTPSLDLDAAQLGALLDSPFGPYAEVIVHHPLPLFHMEHCVFAALLSQGSDHRSCGRPCERHRIGLRDRAGMVHPVEADVGCRNTVFHAAAQSGASLVAAAQRCGVRRFRIELVREDEADTARITRGYRRLLQGDLSAAALWRALRTEGGYGVVRGSLRVLNA